MKSTVIESLENIETFMKNEHNGFWGMMRGNTPGAIAKILTKDRFYFLTIIVDDNLDKVFLDVHPQCVCEKPYRQTVHGYINSHTSTYKSGRIDIDNDSGEVKIRVETQISDHPVSSADLKDMELLAIHISDRIERRLDKLCHGVWFSEDDPDVMGGLERQHKKMIDKLKKDVSHFDNKSDDDDLIDADLDDGNNVDDADNDSKEFLSLMKILESMSSSDSKEEENTPIEAEYSAKSAFEEKRYRLYLLDISDCSDTKMVVKVFEQILGLTEEEVLAAMQNCPCCIAESVKESDASAIKAQLDSLGVKIKMEVNSDI